MVERSHEQLLNMARKALTRRPTRLLRLMQFEATSAFSEQRKVRKAKGRGPNEPRPFLRSIGLLASRARLNTIKQHILTLVNNPATDCEDPIGVQTSPKK
jgi:hypothetical protein